MEMEPDFQRAHVWDDEKRSKFVEHILQGGISGRDIYWNCSTWMGSFDTPMQLVDGLQRITALVKFMNDEIPAFGKKCSEYEGRMTQSVGLRFHVNDLQTRAEVLKWYLELNTGGVVHTEEELEKVRGLLEAEERIE